MINDITLLILNDYKKITAQGDWEKYQNNFTYEFKE